MTIEHRLQRSEGFTFETRPRLKIGDRVVTPGGEGATVLGVGLIDYAPAGPTYEAVEVDFDPPWVNASAKRGIFFAVDLSDGR